MSTPAITTGPLQHTIWLDFKMKGRPELDSVIEHELTHIKHKDTYWLWLICATESVFFWNPLCLLLANLARQQIELSCDESCMEKLSDKYRYDLASLLLSEHQYRYEHASLGHSVLAVSHSKSFNIQRVKTLNKEKKMKLSHLMIITAALSCSALAANQIVSEKQVTQGASKQKSEKSARYQQQLRELLAGAKGAKSNDETQLKAAVSHILNWHSNRGSLNGFEELDIKVKSCRSFFIMTCFFLGLSTFSYSEPYNLAKVYHEVISYHNTGKYIKDLNAVIHEAEAYILAKASALKSTHQPLAVVLDIDENYKDQT